MNSLEALGNLRSFNKTGDKEIYYKVIEHDLQILNLLARYCTFTNNTITFNATITDEHEIKLLKEWLNRE